MNKDITKIIKQLKSLDYEVEHRGHHYKVLKDGIPLADPSNNQLISIPTTPSDNNWKRNLYASLRRAGIDLKRKK